MATKTNAKAAPKTVHNFGEKNEEYSASLKKKIPVVVTQKYLKTKQQIVEMLDSGKYIGLDDSNFWILMNQTKDGRMAYTGLIISHDGMKIINDNLPKEKQVKAGCFSIPVMSEYKKDCMYMYYQDEETMEFGEISVDNCKNSYPYAMLYKRCYDRVVKDKAKMYGVYSEAEADEFAQRLLDSVPSSEKNLIDNMDKAKKQEAPAQAKPEQTEQQTLNTAARVNNEGVDIYAATENMYSFEEKKQIMAHYKVDFWYEMPIEIIEKYYENRKGK